MSIYHAPYEGRSPRWLFCCNHGRLRSATAAVIAQRCLGYNTRACGVDPSWSLVPISPMLVMWAEHIVFMDDVSYQQAQQQLYPLNFKYTKFQVWNTIDRFPYMNHELVDYVKQQLEIVE